MNFIVRWIATALAAGVAAWLVPGIDVLGPSPEAWIVVALYGLVLSLINMVLKPVLQVLSLPITCLTLGIFYLVVNTFLLYVASWVTEGIFHVSFSIATFGSAFVAAIVVSVVSALVNSLLGTAETSSRR